MKGSRRFLAALTMAVVLLGASGGLAQIHPSQLPPLTPDGPFPRCSPRQLATAGFPDHKHAQYWSGWQVLHDAQGVEYGPGTWCEGKQLKPRPDLIVEPAVKRAGPFAIYHNPGYGVCDMVQFLELLDWAGHEVPPLLGLELPDSLAVLNPDNLPRYTEMTGYGMWRLYKLEGDRVIMEPWPILQSRTLDAHAAFMLVTDWILQDRFGDALPPWFRQGLVEYCGEDGQHLVNYMAQFRTDGPVTMPPALVDALLTRGPDADPQKDREVYRKACYSAFLMVWELAENRGGLQAVRECLDLMTGGDDFSTAAVAVYGLDAEELAASLDATVMGEPGGKNPPLPVPHLQP